jgi:hypothetical protein
MTKNFLLPLTCAAISIASLVSTSAANALTFFTSNTASFNPRLTELTGNPTLNLPNYAPTAGQTVTKITISASATLSTFGTLTNNAANPQDFTFLVTGRYRLTGIPGIASPFTVIPSLTILGEQEYFQAAPGVGLDFSNGGQPYTFTNSASSVITSGSSIAAFLANGPIVAAPFTLISTTVSGGGGNVANDLTTFASGTLQYTVEGTFTPPTTEIPFEFSPALGLVALGGLYAANRFFKSAKA